MKEKPVEAATGAIVAGAPVVLGSDVGVGLAVDGGVGVTVGRRDGEGVEVLLLAAIGGMDELVAFTLDDELTNGLDVLVMGNDALPVPPVFTAAAEPVPVAVRLPAEPPALEAPVFEAAVAPALGALLHVETGVQMY